jgi:hypothetical protein
MTEGTATIRSLLDNNPEYGKLIVRYEEKLANAVTIMTDAEFWQEELDRIKEFLKPMVISVGGDFVKGREFNFTLYDKLAFDWIKAGDNWPLSSIFANAKQDYESKLGRIANENEFNEGLLYALNKGASMVLYEKFLKENLRQRQDSGLTGNQTVYLGMPGESYSVYDLIKLLDKNGSDDNMLFEIHDPGGMQAGGASEEFVRRSTPYYISFINPGVVDQQTSTIISYAARIKGLWYFSEDSGSNHYLGTGPTSVLDIRKFCSEKAIRILYTEKSFDQWLKELLGNTVREKEIVPKAGGDRTIIYEKINRILKLTGNSFCRSLNTAKKQDENGCRDYFVGGLSSHPEMISLAEAQNRQGRTDILVIDKENDYRFIYEFKIYKETSDINKGLDQIINQYPTQIDRHNGLVILNRKKGDINKLIELIDERVAKTDIEISTRGQLAEDRHTRQVIYKHPRDSEVECVLTIFVFDIQE